MREPSKAERRAVRAAVGAYHEVELAKLIERVREGIARLDAAEMDAFELDDLIHHHYHRAVDWPDRVTRVMPIPAAVRDDAVRQVAAFCERRVPVDLRDKLRLEHSVRGGRIAIVERRPPWSELIGPDWTSTNVAQLRYDERSGRWTLYAADRNDRWFLYDDVGPSRDVGPLLAEIDEDPTAIFWG